MFLKLLSIDDVWKASREFGRVQGKNPTDILFVGDEAYEVYMRLRRQSTGNEFTPSGPIETERLLWMNVRMANPANGVSGVFVGELSKMSVPKKKGCGELTLFFNDPNPVLDVLFFVKLNAYRKKQSQRVRFIFYDEFDLETTEESVSYGSFLEVVGGK